MSTNLSVEIEDKLSNTLEILAKKTGRKKSDLVEEALEMLFEEYKELILDT